MADGERLAFPPPLPHKFESMRGPAFTNWIIKGHLLTGPHPGPISLESCIKNLTEILRDGVTTFVCLQPEMPSPMVSAQKNQAGLPSNRARNAYGSRNVVSARPYIDTAQVIVDKGDFPQKRKHKLAFVHIPIPETGGATIPDEDLIPPVLDLLAHLRAGEILYLQCADGNGRSGTIAALLLGLVYGLSSSEAIDACQRYRNDRPGTGGQAPETHEQKMQIHRLLRNERFLEQAKEVKPRPSGETGLLTRLDLQILLKKIRSALGRQGPASVIYLGRNLTRGGKTQLSMYDFSKSLYESGLRLTEEELRLLYGCYAPGATPNSPKYDAPVTDVQAFLEGLKSPFPENRLKLVHEVFKTLDVEQDGHIDMDDVSVLFNPTGHPDVRAGKRSEKEVLEEFLDTFNVRSRRRKVSIAEFEDYYACLSAAIEDDNYFQLLMWNTWPLAQAKARNQDAAGTRIAPSKEEEFMVPSDQRHAWNTTNFQRVPLTASALEAYAGTPRGRGEEYDGQHAALVTKPIGETLQLVRNQLCHAGPTACFKLKRELVADAPREALENAALDECDVPLRNIKAGLMEALPSLPSGVVHRIMEHFDTKGNGRGNLGAILDAFRDELSASRRSLVQQAFEKIDRSGDGRVPLQDVLAAYCPNRHPSVVAGKATEEQVFKEFLGDFTLGLAGNVVFLPHFEDYHRWLSLCYPNDDHFRLLVWELWNLSKRASSRASYDAEALLSRRLGKETGIVSSIDRLAHHHPIISQSPHSRSQRAHYAHHMAEKSHDDAFSHAEGGSDQPLTSRGGFRMGAATRALRGEDPSQRSVATEGGVVDVREKRSPSSVARMLLESQDAASTSSNGSKVLAPAFKPTPSGYVGRNGEAPRTPPQDGQNYQYAASAREASQEHFLSPRERAELEGVGSGSRHMATLGNIGYGDHRGMNAADPYSRQDARDGDDVLWMRDRGKRLFAHESKTYRSDVPWDTRDGPMTSDEDVRRLRSQYIHGGQGDEHQSSSAAERQMSDAQQAREHIKQVLRKRGLRGIFLLERTLTSNAGGEDSITLAQFIRALGQFGISLPKREAEAVFMQFRGANNDRGEATAPIRSLIYSIHNGLNSGRREVVQTAFNKLDVAGAGAVPIDSVRMSYNSRAHPDVKGGRRLEADVLKEFLETFDHAGPDGLVRPQDFEDYYAGVGFCIDDDNEFRYLLWNTWDLHEIASGGYMALTPAAHALPGQEVSVATPRGKSTRSYGIRSPGSGTRSVGGSSAAIGVEVSIGDVRRRLIKSLMQHGVDGFIKLKRRLHEADSGHTAVLARSVFAGVLFDYGVGLSSSEASAVFSEYDPNVSGRVPYRAFLRDLCGPLPQNRAVLVQKAWDKLDPARSGLVTVETIAVSYNASEDNRVKAGDLTARGAVAELIKDLFPSGPRGEVTARDFEEYYRAVSAAVREDSFFQLLLWNSWLSGVQSKTPIAFRRSSRY